MLGASENQKSGKLWRQCVLYFLKTRLEDFVRLVTKYSFFFYQHWPYDSIDAGEIDIHGCPSRRPAIKSVVAPDFQTTV